LELAGKLLASKNPAAPKDLEGERTIKELKGFTDHDAHKTILKKLRPGVKPAQE